WHVRLGVQLLEPESRRGCQRSDRSREQYRARWTGSWAAHLFLFRPPRVRVQGKCPEGFWENRIGVDAHRAGRDAKGDRLAAAGLANRSTVDRFSSRARCKARYAGSESAAHACTRSDLTGDATGGGAAER